MQWISTVLQRITRTWWLFLLVFVLNFASIGILFALEEQFTVITGRPVFDTQNDLTGGRIIAELPLYTGPAGEAYFRFAAFDFVFPFVAALFLAVLWTFFLRTMTWQVGRGLLAWHFPLAAFIVTAADYLENFSVLLLLGGVSTPASGGIQAILLFKQLKLTLLSLSGAITAILCAIAALNWIARLAVARRTARSTTGKEA